LYPIYRDDDDNVSIPRIQLTLALALRKGQLQRETQAREVRDRLEPHSLVVPY
jgi:hypothetical protein